LIFPSIFAAGAIIGGLVYWNWDEAVQLVAMGVNYVRYMGAPAGTISTEVAADFVPPDAIQQKRSAVTNAHGASEDWPSYNKTLTSNRFSQLTEITPANAGGLKVLCTYDTWQ
jgi:alcohol dehydrogenase (cytochrome c)